MNDYLTLRSFSHWCGGAWVTTTRRRFRCDKCGLTYRRGDDPWWRRLWIWLWSERP